MSARFCHNCGNRLQENAKFCTNCGTPVPQKPATPEPEPQPEPIVIPEPIAAEPATPKPPVVFTLDSLEEPIPAPEKPADKPPMIFSLDSLPKTEAPQEDPVPEPQPEPAPASEPAPVQKPTAEPAAAAEPKKLKKQKKSKEGKAPKEKGGWPSRSGGRTVLAVLLCVLIFVWSFASLTLLNVRLATTGEQGQKTLTTVVRSLDLTHIQASVLTDELQDPDASLADWIAGKIAENYQGRVELDSVDLKEFWEDSTFPDFLVTHLNNCLTDIYTGSSSAEITVEDIQALLQSNAALIDEIFDEQLSEADIAQIAATAVDSGALDLISTESLKESAGAMYSILQIGLSWWVIGVAALILLLLILLLGKVNGSVLRTFGDAGITLMVMSAVWCISGLLILAMPDLWNALFYSIRPVGTVIGSVLTASLIPSAIVFGVGILLLLVKIIGKTIVIKSAKTQA